MKSCVYLLLMASSLQAADFPQPYNSEPDPSAAPPAAAEAVKMFDLPEGFEVRVFASEPEIGNPIAMAWDARGRLWVAENYTYAERAMRFDLTLRDRITILEDQDGDGHAEVRKVFTDDVRMLTSVEVGRGGVWLMCPPQLLFIPDRDGDDIPDGEPEVKLDGFTVAKSNYHNFANGLRWGPDGWLYGRCGHSCPGNLGKPGTPEAGRIPMEGGIWRYHPEREAVEVLTHGTTNPWGHDWNEHGELFFINTVNGHLWHGIPGAHFRESGGESPNPLIYDRLDMHADHWHYDRSGKWQDSRGGKADEYGGGHAHIGMMIYQADQWPEEYRGRLFTLNMHGFRANVERLERHGGGYLGRHQGDVFRTRDPWFRGIDIRQGPDGSAYLLDWSDTGECHEHTGVHRTSGRIYRIGHGAAKLPDVAGWQDVRAVLRHPNVWFERQLRNRLVTQALHGSQPAAESKMLRAAFREEKDVVVRLRALWTLHALGDLTVKEMRGLLGEPDEHLRAWGIRLLLDDRPIDTMMGPRVSARPEPLPARDFQRLIEMARSDESGLVRLALASSLQRLPVDQRAELGTALASRAGDADDHNLPSIVWYGLSPLARENPKALLKVMKDCRWPRLRSWIARSMTAAPAND